MKTEVCHTCRGSGGVVDPDSGIEIDCEDCEGTGVGGKQNKPSIKKMRDHDDDHSPHKNRSAR